MPDTIDRMSETGLNYLKLCKGSTNGTCILDVAGAKQGHITAYKKLVVNSSVIY